MNLIADTNVWYWISDGRRNQSDLKSGGNRLIAHPISIIEIIADIKDDNHEKRRAAAQAILDHADDVAEDSESHLVRLWGLEPRALGLDWLDLVVTVAKSHSVAEITTGVNDVATMRRLTVNIALIKSLRDVQWNDFCTSVVAALDYHCPGYKAARLRGERLSIDLEHQPEYKKVLSSEEFQRYLAAAVFARALLVKDLPYRIPSEAEFARALPNLKCYLDAYSEYIFRCATQFSPQRNDLADSECFLYLQDTNSFLSSDKRWVRIAREVCPNNVYDPENKVDN
jgi:hypothetical protein